MKRLLLSALKAIVLVYCCGWSAAADAQTRDTVILSIDSVTVEPGSSQVCVPVRAQRLNNVLTMQFSILWDTTQLILSHMENKNALSSLNGNTSAVNPYFFSMAWYHPLFQPATVAPGTVLFELCFDVLTESGSSDIFFATSPTPFEFYSGDEELMAFQRHNGHANWVADERLVVWPGDTNADSLVNHFDLLPIGLAYGATGPTRPGASTEWRAQPAPDWSLNLGEENINYAHLDTDGNGLIEAVDTLAITRNWTKTIGLRAPDGQPRNNTTLFVLPGEVNGGEPLALPIMLGDGQTPVEDVYGLAFSIQFDANMLQTADVYVTLEDSWLTSDGARVLHLDRAELVNGVGRLDVAMTRTNGTVIDGSGRIATLHIWPIAPGPGQTIPLDFSTFDAMVIDTAGSERAILTQTTTTTVTGPVSTQEPEILQQLRCYPTPTTGLVFIDAGSLAVKEIEVWSAEGQLVQRLAPADRLDLQSLPRGAYWLRVVTEEGTAVRRVVKL